MQPTRLVLVRRIRRPDGGFMVREIDLAAQVLRCVHYQALLCGWQPLGWHLRP